MTTEIEQVGSPWHRPSKAFFHIILYAIGFCHPGEAQVGITRTFDAGTNKVNIYNHVQLEALAVSRSEFEKLFPYFNI